MIAALDLDALVAYVDAVFDATTAWLDGLGSMVLDTVPDTADRLRDLAGIPASIDWLVSMWSDRPVWWLLQWPVIGHGHAHVGQAWRRAQRPRPQPVRRQHAGAREAGRCAAARAAAATSPRCGPCTASTSLRPTGTPRAARTSRPDVERWCYACLASYPHELVED